MFQINEDKSIYVTRGDIAVIPVSAKKDGKPYTFQAGDVLRLKVFVKKDAENVVLEKDFPVTANTQTVELFLDEKDTKFGGVISKPRDYWYEVELNPFDNPQTLIGYDEDGAKVFRLFPEGADHPEYVPDPEIIKVIDTELDMASERPVQNQVIARAFANLQAGYQEIYKAVTQHYVTPEMFGAIGNGVADDSEAIQLALSCGVPVKLAAKTYLCKDIITKDIADVVMIGTTGTVVKWNITTTQGLRSQASMISDDAYKNTPYMCKGRVYLENIIFDGNGSNIVDFPVDDAFALCAFYTREHVIVNNCTFRNCHCDGLMARGLRGSLTVLGSRFENLGLYQPTNGTRNGITVTRSYWDRETAQTLLVESPLHVTIENCSFENIGDECCRADGITNLSLRNCHFNKIGHHILETGHMTDTTEYMHEIANCVGDKIASSVYNCGADGGGAFPYRGKVTVTSCEFKSMAWQGSTAVLARKGRAALIEGFTAGYKPDVYLENCRFSSGITKDELTYEDTGYFLCGENVIVKSCHFDYAHINMAQVFPCFASLVMEHCTFNLPSIDSDYFTRMGQNNGRVRFIGCVFSHENIYLQVLCACVGASIVFDKNRFNCEGYCLVKLNTVDRAEVRFTENTFHKTLSGRLIHSDNTEQTASTVFVFGNNFPENFCGWGTLSNISASFKKGAYNSYGNFE